MEEKKEKKERPVEPTSAKQGMSKEQALEIVGRVCTSYKGDLNEHTIIQQALSKLQSK